MTTITFRLFTKNSILLSSYFRLSDELCLRKFDQVVLEIAHVKFSLVKIPIQNIYRVGTYGKIHCERGTTYSVVPYWILAMINDQIKNRCFLGNFWGAELESEVLLAQKNTKNRRFGGVLKITWRSDSQTTSSTGVLRTGMDTRIEELHLESHNC